MPNTICTDHSFFTITGEPFFSGKQVDFQLEFNSSTDEGAVLACQWYLNGVLVTGQRQTSFTDILNCGAYTIGARVLTASGWSGIKTLRFQTCKVPLDYTIIGPASLREGSTAEYRVLLNYSDGSVDDVTTGYTFNANHGTFSGNSFTIPTNNVTLDTREALVTALKNGVPELTKTVEIIDTTPRTITALQITGPDAVKEGGSANYAVTATYGDGTISDYSSDYTFYCKDGSFLGGSFIAYKDTTENNSRSSTVVAFKHGIPQLAKTIQILDVKPDQGVLVVDILGTGNIDVIGMISNTEIGGGQLSAYTGKNVVLSGAEASNAFMLASDLINQSDSSLNWRFEFNIKKLLSSYPQLTEFVFTVKGRGYTSGLVNGVYSLRSTDALMTMHGPDGNFIPVVSGGTSSGIVPFSSVLAGGANGSHLKEDLTSIVQFTYHVATNTVTVAVPEVQSIGINGPAAINEGASATYSVIANYDNGLVLNETSAYSFSASEGTFSGATLSIPSNDNPGDSRQVLITASKGDPDALTKSINIVDKSSYVSMVITGPTIVKEGSSNNYKVIGSYSNGKQDDLTNYYSFSSTEGTFAGDTLTIPSNNTQGDDRTAIITASRESADTLTMQINIVDNSTIVINEFDYMMVRYIWDEGSGLDLDVMVGFENNGTAIDNNYVGFGNNKLIPAGTSPEANAKLWWALDDQSTKGIEGVLIGIKSFIDTYPNAPNIIQVGLYAVWYQPGVQSGDFKIELATYKGGTMIRDSNNQSNIINVGGIPVLSATQNLNTKIQNQNHNVSSAYKAGVLKYDKSLQQATIQFFNNWP